ncbi:MFS transporter [Weissella soli]|uniref:MFS transporter n=1 Tax=Weissella soli TaxID=155866 RepID=UPI001F46F30E|nr:MFS transporter [Weissella soli]GJM47976.1 MFS transporter [Weissella soli]
MTMKYFHFKRSGVIWIILVASITSYLDAGLIVSTGVALPLWTKEYSLSPLMAGLIPTILTLSVATGSIIGGMLADNIGRMKMFRWNILFIFIGTLLIAFGNTLLTLLIGVVVAGLSSGADLPTSLSVISERVSVEENGKAISITQLFWTLGILLSQFLGFATVSLDTQGTIIIFGFLSVVALFGYLIRHFSKKFNQLASLLKQQSSPIIEGTNTDKLSMSQIFSDKQVYLPFIALTIFYIAWNLPANTWGTFENYFLVVISGREQSYATLLALLTNIGGLALNVWYLKMVDTKYRNILMIAGILMALTSFTTAAIFGGQWIIFSIIYVVYSLSTTLAGEPLYKIWSQNLYPSNMRASLTGLSYGIVRVLTAGFALITPTIMAISPTALMWFFVVLVIIYGWAARVAASMTKKTESL